MPKISPEQTISRELALHIALATTVVNLAVRKMPPGDPRADLAVMMHLNGADPTVAWKVCGEPGSVANIRVRAKRERAKRGETGPLVSNTCVRDPRAALHASPTVLRPPRVALALQHPRHCARRICCHSNDRFVPRAQPALTQA